MITEKLKKYRDNDYIDGAILMFVIFFMPNIVILLIITSCPDSTIQALIFPLIQILAIITGKYCDK